MEQLHPNSGTDFGGILLEFHCCRFRITFATSTNGIFFTTQFENVPKLVPELIGWNDLFMDGAQTGHYWGAAGFYCFQVFRKLFFGNTPEQKMPMPTDHVFSLIAELVINDFIIPGSIMPIYDKPTKPAPIVRFIRERVIGCG
jgi:hypothetical protein